MQNKALTAAVIFGIVVVSFAVLLGQAGNFFSKAQGTPKITGTVVLTDSYETIKSSFPTGANVYTISLPGSTACKVKITACNNSGSVNAPALYSLVYATGGSDPNSSSRLTEIGNTGANRAFFSAVKITAGGSILNCQASAYDSVAPGTYILMPASCTKAPASNSTWADCTAASIPSAYYNLSVAYECT